MWWEFRSSSLLPLLRSWHLGKMENSCQKTLSVVSQSNDSGLPANSRSTVILIFFRLNWTTVVRQLAIRPVGWLSEIRRWPVAVVSVSCRLKWSSTFSVSESKNSFERDTVQNAFDNNKVYYLKSLNVVILFLFPAQTEYSSFFCRF